jgi:NosR/NirI family transcriptional regulator, nitrous oxide reductase regulator
MTMNDEVRLNAPMVIKGTPKNSQREKILVVITIFSLVLAFVLGLRLETKNVTSHLKSAFSSADRFEKGTANSYSAVAEGKLLGYVSISEADGYGGPVKIATGIDRSGKIVGLSVVKQTETPSWYRRILKANFQDLFIGKSVTEPFKLGEDIDAVSGATYTSKAITAAVKMSSQDIAKNELGIKITEPGEKAIAFGVPEIVLLLLISLWGLSRIHQLKNNRFLRWASLLISLFLLGFVYNSPLTLTFINKFLLGYWPEWQNHLYWYILIIFITATFLFSSKNYYCQWICPFGAAQECLNVLGGAKSRIPNRFQDFFRWSQRSLTWSAILLALLYRNPAITSYEIFGNLFALEGSSFQFVLLAIVMIASIFIKKPWCRYLCPIRPVYDILKKNRTWIKEKWNLIKAKQTTETI